MPTAPHKRFAWNDLRDAQLARDWLIKTPELSATFFGCSVRSIYKRAGELNLGPRDPVQRALWLGEVPRDPRAITLPHVPLLDRPFDDADQFCSTADEPASAGRPVLPASGSSFGDHQVRAAR